MVQEVRKKTKGRPRTHLSRERQRQIYEIKPRPKTTRVYAPISYNDLSICYESFSSDEGSPIRQPFSVYKKQSQPKLVSNDQYSMLSIKSSKFDKLSFNESIPKTGSKVEYGQSEQINVHPKPYLSIIDFNQLTRGSIDKAVASSSKKDASRRN